MSKKQTKKKVIVNNSKIILGVAALFILVVGIFIGSNNNVNFPGVSANPDYICKKSISGGSCEITTCGAWSSNGSRVCTGQKKVEEYYYNRRTNCRSGYSQTHIGNSGGSSGPTSPMYYVYESCSITEVDNVAPSGKIN